MGRQPSSVDLLPDDVREKLQELLRDPRCSQLAAVARINEILAAEGQAPLSKSAVNRYALKMEEAGAKLRQSREIAEMWIGKLGAEPQGQLGHLVNEVLRTLCFDMALTIQKGELDAENVPETVEMVQGLALAYQRLEAASSLNVKREQEVRRRAKEEAAEAATHVAKRGGLSADTVQALRREILGMGA